MAERTKPSGNGAGPAKPILVSPLADAVDPELRELWQARGVPELFWIAELLRGRHLRDGFRLAITVARAARAASRRQSFTLFAAAGSYRVLESDGFERLRRTLADGDALQPLSAALLDLVTLFPAHPLAALASPSLEPAAGSPLAAFQRLRDRLEAFYDPASRAALRVELVVLWQAVQAGVLRGGNAAAIAELAHATRFPLTPESVPAARAVLGLAGQVLRIEALLPATDWPDQFWSRLAELELEHGAGAQRWRP